MPSHRHVFCAAAAALCLGVAGALRADPEAGPPPAVEPAAPSPADDLPAGDGGDASLEEMQVLERFLALPPDKLGRLRALLERIEQMAPEQRRALRARVRQFMEVAKRDVQEFQRLWESFPTADREALRRRWLRLTPAERLRERSTVKEMSPEERRVYLERAAADFRREAGHTPGETESARGPRPGGPAYPRLRERLEQQRRQPAPDGGTAPATPPGQP